ncbi:unnamed protein product [Diplocarpon coronariae]
MNAPPPRERDGTPANAPVDPPPLAPRLTREFGPASVSPTARPGLHVQYLPPALPCPAVFLVACDPSARALGAVLRTTGGERTSRGERAGGDRPANAAVVQ